MNGHPRPNKKLSLKQMMTVRLEDLASKSDQFLKAQKNLISTGFSFALFSLLENFSILRFNVESSG